MPYVINAIKNCAVVKEIKQMIKGKPSEDTRCPRCNKLGAIVRTSNCFVSIAYYCLYCDFKC